MTDKYAVFGNPVAHSLSPDIHRRFAGQTGQDMQYCRQRVEPGEFEAAARAFFAGGGKGLNITVPFKLDAYAFAGQLSKRARQAGAVNTLLQRPDQSILGDNTDGVGLVRDLCDNLEWRLEGQRVLILGAGGAVRGVIAPLLQQRVAQLTVANRTVEKARQLATAFSSLGVISSAGFEQLPGSGFDLVINGTSAGLSGHMPDLPGGLFAAGGCAYDMVYGAEPTGFMQWARQQGADAVADGLGMLVEQAAESFSLWRGMLPETAPVIAAVRQSLT